MEHVRITVVRSVGTGYHKGYGYNLRHNQKPGFKGIIGNTFAWYRYKRDAIERAEALERAYNAERTTT